MSAVLPSVADKPRTWRLCFGRIAPRYDLMNTLMTGGQDARWRRIVAESLSLGGSAQVSVLDVGTRTGKLPETVGRAVPQARLIGDCRAAGTWPPWPDVEVCGAELRNSVTGVIVLAR